MRNVAVNAAVGKKTHKMDGGIVVTRILHGCLKRFVFEEITVLDLLGDTGKLLIYDAAGTHVHMSDLGIAHLSIRKAYCKSAGISLYKRIILHERIDHRSICHVNSVCLMSFIQSESIKDHKYGWFFAHCFLLCV